MTSHLNDCFANCDVLIIGASYGGANVAGQLRHLGFSGSIVIVGDESAAPYERPPLSKAYFMGKLEPDRLKLRSDSYWSDHRITLILNARVDRVTPHNHMVHLTDGRSLRYGKLVWAAGARPRVLEGPQPVHSLRSLADVQAISSCLGRAGKDARLTIIGGGYIGLELAAAATNLGYLVHVVESQGRVLARVTSEPVSVFYQNLHRGHGVSVLLNCSGVTIEENFVRLSDGRVIPTDVVVAGIGVVPNVEPLVASGVACDARIGGVSVDKVCQSSDADILAVGDCAAHSNPYAADSNPIRVESVSNAVEQAKIAAANIAGTPKPYNSLPWFWSDQYDTKLQTAGLAAGYDDLRVRRSNDSENNLSVGYWRGDQLIAVDAINRVADFVASKLLIAARRPVDKTAFSDASVSLKSLML